MSNDNVEEDARRWEAILVDTEIERETRTMTRGYAHVAEEAMARTEQIRARIERAGGKLLRVNTEVNIVTTVEFYPKPEGVDPDQWAAAQTSRTGDPIAVAVRR